MVVPKNFHDHVRGTHWFLVKVDLSGSLAIDTPFLSYAYVIYVVFDTNFFA